MSLRGARTVGLAWGRAAGLTLASGLFGGELLVVGAIFGSDRCDVLGGMRTVGAGDLTRSVRVPNFLFSCVVVELADVFVHEVISIIVNFALGALLEMLFIP